MVKAPLTSKTQAMSDWNAKFIEEFRGNDGRMSGDWAGQPVLLLHTTGAKSGQERVNPMMYLEKEGRLFVFASKAGAPTNPDWYHNLLAHPGVTAEIGTETIAAAARPLPEPERTEVFDQQASLHPGFRGYQDKTARAIPVVELVRN
jgi:deazaflavin-dependent oxidoreductase (nitroreductase family)